MILKSRFYPMLLALLVGFASCNKEELIVSNDGKLAQAQTNVYVDNGILVFESKEAIEQEMKALEAGTLALVSELKIKEGFHSLKNFNEQRLMLKSGLSVAEELEEPDADDAIVKDPYLQEVLNGEREVIVGGKLYKITEYGVLRTEPDNLGELNQFIEAHPDFSGIENDPTVDEFIEVDDNIELFLPREIYSPSFIIPIDESPDGPGGSGGSGGSSSSGAGLAKRNIELANMNECDEDNKTLAGEALAGILGYSVNCENYFTDHRRVKTVFWAQNFWIKSSVGVKVKMQKKHTGIWWARDAERLELGWGEVKYKVKIDMQPSYFSLSLSPEVFQTKFKDVFWVDILKDFVDEFKIETGQYPKGYDLHRKMCEKNFKEWTIRSVPEYADFADLQVYILKSKKNDFWFNVTNIGGKISYDLLYAELKKYGNKNNNQAIIDAFKKVPLNKSITLIDEDMNLERVVMPHEAAYYANNDNKIEFLLDSHSGAIGGGVAWGGGKPMFNALFFKTPVSYSMREGSSAYGIARYYGSWRGSYIKKKAKED